MRQRLEGEVLAFAALDLRIDHQHEVFDTDAVGAWLVVARLVRQDHAFA